MFRLTWVMRLLWKLSDLLIRVLHGQMVKKSLITCILVNKNMMTSSNGNIFHATGPLCGELIGHRWIPLTKNSDAKLWYFIWMHPPLTHKSEQYGYNCVDSVQCIIESVVYIDSNVSKIFAKDLIQNKSALDQLMACDQKATILCLIERWPCTLT